MNSDTNIASFCAKSETAKKNFDRGYAVGLTDGLEQANTNATERGFWWGVATAAVLVMIVWLAILFDRS